MSTVQQQRLADAKSADVALLASVPYQHLVSGLDTLAEVGRVAYGTDNGMVLSELDHELQGQTCVVLIYPSGPSPYSGPPRARWRAVYSRQRGAVAGKHPDPSVRPASTDTDGAFLTYWEVLDLEELAAEKMFLLKDLKPFRKNKRLASNYIPIGPLLIANPY